MKKTLIAYLIIGISITSFAQKTDIIIPSEIAREQVIHHNSHSLSYSSAYVMPSWLSYKMTNKEIDQSIQVKGKYVANPVITSRSASKKDYKDSGYLMAQLASYLDLYTIEGSKEESFYMSNIVPMKTAFHKHIWLKSEDLIRHWLGNTEALYVICGPVNKEAPFKTFGKGKVSIPKRYYKIVYDAKNNQAIGFLFKNGMSSGTMKSYVKSVAEMEEFTGINFFPDMEESKAKELKSSVDFDFWKFEFDKVKF